MIDFTEHIDFFRLFDFSTSWWEVKMIKFTKLLDYFRLLDFSTSYWEVKIIDFTEYRSIRGKYPPPSKYPPPLVKGKKSIFQKRDFETFSKIHRYG